MKNSFIGLIFCLLLWSVCISACQMENGNEKKVKDLEFTLVEEEEIPKELLEKIEEKKAADMKLVFESGEYTYIVRGYGEQETGGYSIQIPKFYLTNNAVVLETKLLGPPKGSVENVTPSFPYVVIRTQTLSKNVIFK